MKKNEKIGNHAHPVYGFLVSDSEKKEFRRIKKRYKRVGISLVGPATPDIFNLGCDALFSCNNGFSLYHPSSFTLGDFIQDLR